MKIREKTYAYSWYEVKEKQFYTVLQIHVINLKAFVQLFLFFCCWKIKIDWWPNVLFWCWSVFLSFDKNWQTFLILQEIFREYIKHTIRVSTFVCDIICVDLLRNAFGECTASRDETLFREWVYTTIIYRRCTFHSVIGNDPYLSEICLVRKIKTVGHGFL